MYPQRMPTFLKTWLGKLTPEQSTRVQMWLNDALSEGRHALIAENIIKACPPTYKEKPGEGPPKLAELALFASFIESLPENSYLHSIMTHIEVNVQVAIANDLGFVELDNLALTAAFSENLPPPLDLSSTVGYNVIAEE